MLDLSLETFPQASALRIGLTEHRAVHLCFEVGDLAFFELATLRFVGETVRVARRVDRDHQEARLVHLHEYSRP